MILTVTINPLLEKRFTFSSVELGKANRSETLKYAAGGKGININRQLNKLGSKNNAITFAGGNNGKIFRQVLAKENINAVLVPMKSELRWSAGIEEREKKRVTHYFSPNHSITEKEAEEFISRLRKMIPNSSMVIFAGSSPCAAADVIFEEGIKIARREDKMVLLDTYGSHLPKLVESAPMMLHNNLDEINTSFGLNLAGESEITSFLKELYGKGIKIAVISDGPRKFYAMKFGFLYRVAPPKSVAEIDSTGSGDAFNAGFAAGLEKGLTFDECVDLGCKLGAFNAAMWETCSVNLEDVKNLSSTVIENIGKQLKLIDDSPTI